MKKIIAISFTFIVLVTVITMSFTSCKKSDENLKPSVKNPFDYVGVEHNKSLEFMIQNNYAKLPINQQISILKSQSKELMQKSNDDEIANLMQKYYTSSFDSSLNKLVADNMITIYQSEKLSELGIILKNFRDTTQTIISINIILPKIRTGS